MAGSILTCFSKRESDCHYSSVDPLMSLFAVGKADGTYVVMIDRTYSYKLRVTYAEGRYSIEILSELSKQPKGESVRLRMFKLPAGSDYNQVARFVRNYKLGKGEIQPLSDKAKAREIIRYSIKHPLIRIRMCWKPVPPEILHQTLENEPKMYTACTFSRVRDIADELHRQGIEGAEICLVGWNIKGHDGRWPQIFPVEEAFCGEEELLRTVT